MHPKLQEARELRSKFLNPLRGSEEPIELMAAYVDRDIELLDSLASRINNATASNAFLNWTAIQIELAVYGLKPAVQLRPSTSGNFRLWLTGAVIKRWRSFI